MQNLWQVHRFAPLDSKTIEASVLSNSTKKMVVIRNEKVKSIEMKDLRIANLSLTAYGSPMILLFDK